MMDETLEMLRRYLNGSIKLDTLENYVIIHAPDAEGELRDLLDQIAVEIFYIWDEVSDETLFRERVAELVGPDTGHAIIADNRVTAV